MIRCLPYALLLLCPLSHAECAVNRSDAGTLSISVSGNGPCFRSQEERAAFAEDFKSMVRAETAGQSAAHGKPGRDSREALNNFDHLRRQSDTLNNRGPSYYGQRR